MGNMNVKRADFLDFIKDLKSYDINGDGVINGAKVPTGEPEESRNAIRTLVGHKSLDNYVRYEAESVKLIKAIRDKFRCSAITASEIFNILDTADTPFVQNINGARFYDVCDGSIKMDILQNDKKIFFKINRLIDKVIEKYKKMDQSKMLMANYANDVYAKDIIKELLTFKKAFVQK